MRHKSPLSSSGEKFRFAVSRITACPPVHEAAGAVDHVDVDAGAHGNWLFGPLPAPADPPYGGLGRVARLAAGAGREPRRLACRG
ncbi:hypothetical protein GCM10027161_33540 [Microbispora hainanensis]